MSSAPNNELFKTVPNPTPDPFQSLHEKLNKLQATVDQVLALLKPVTTKPSRKPTKKTTKEEVATETTSTETTETTETTEVVEVEEPVVAPPPPLSPTERLQAAWDSLNLPYSIQEVFVHMTQHNKGTKPTEGLLDAVLLGVAFVLAQTNPDKAMASKALPFLWASTDHGQFALNWYLKDPFDLADAMSDFAELVKSRSQRESN